MHVLVKAKIVTIVIMFLVIDVFRNFLFSTQ